MWRFRRAGEGLAREQTGTRRRTGRFAGGKISSSVIDGELHLVWLLYLPGKEVLA